MPEGAFDGEAKRKAADRPTTEKRNPPRQSARQSYFARERPKDFASQTPMSRAARARPNALINLRNDCKKWSQFVPGRGSNPACVPLSRLIVNRSPCAKLLPVSGLIEIQKAIEKLSVEQRMELRQWLQALDNERGEVPNAETIEAIEAGRRGEVASFNSLKDLMADLNAEDRADPPV